MHIPNTNLPRTSLVKVTCGQSSYDQNDLQINQDEPLVAFYNRYLAPPSLSANCRQNSLSIDSGFGPLGISFQRTIRVPETGKPNSLPPGLGSFPLYNVAEFAHVLPQDMVEKGGLFFAMYRKFDQLGLKLDVFSLICCCTL
jgi:hypothetical protein